MASRFAWAGDAPSYVPKWCIDQPHYLCSLAKPWVAMDLQTWQNSSSVGDGTAQSQKQCVCGLQDSPIDFRQVAPPALFAFIFAWRLNYSSQECASQLLFTKLRRVTLLLEEACSLQVHEMTFKPTLKSSVFMNSREKISKSNYLPV